MYSRWITSTLVALASLASTPVAQLPPAANTARQQLVSEFDRKAPKVGDAVGEIELLDAEGKPFNLTSLRGQYSVLVFGCLT